MSNFLRDACGFDDEERDERIDELEDRITRLEERMFAEFGRPVSEYEQKDGWEAGD